MIPYKLDFFGEHWMPRIKCSACQGGSNSSSPLFGEGVTIRGGTFLCPEGEGGMSEICQWGDEPLDTMSEFKIFLSICIM